VQEATEESRKSGATTRLLGPTITNQKKGEQTNMNIRKYLGTSVLSLALFLLSGIPTLAKDSQTVTISYGFVLSGRSLPAGQYTVQWETHSPEATVEFVQHHKLLLSTEGRLEERTGHYNRNAVVYTTAPDGTVSLSEIRFARSNKVLVFNQ
jgi:hypothetical protein